MSEEGKKKRAGGFASLTAEQRSEIARRGGRAAQAAGNAHRFTSEEAKVAGRRGGLARKAQKEREEAAKKEASDGNA